LKSFISKSFFIPSPARLIMAHWWIGA
jgi:hypothetical protein